MNIKASGELSDIIEVIRQIPCLKCALLHIRGIQLLLRGPGCTGFSFAL